jgi:hypothetical protein
VHHPPAQKKGFSMGFVSFFDSSAGVLFALFNLAIFYLAAVIAFSCIWEEWSVIDSLYFATITFTSVGETLMVKCLMPRPVGCENRTYFCFMSHV